MPLIIETYLSKREVYASGAITVRDLEPITIRLKPEVSSTPYDILIKFIYKEGQEASVGWSTSANGEINISIANFDSPWGLTLPQPIPIGTFNERPIFLDFVVYTLGNDPRGRPPKLFCYTLLLGD
jgi:hypothetical protein